MLRSFGRGLRPCPAAGHLDTAKQIISTQKLELDWEGGEEEMAGEVKGRKRDSRGDGNRTKLEKVSQGTIYWTRTGL